jgi:hypothetical protein
MSEITENQAVRPNLPPSLRQPLSHAACLQGRVRRTTRHGTGPLGLPQCRQNRISQSAPLGRDLWGPILRGMNVANNQENDLRVSNLTRYLEHLQVK